MNQIAQEQKYILLIAPVRRGRNNRLPAGCDEGKAFPLLIVLIYLYLEKLADEKLTGKDGKTILNTIHTKVDGFNSAQIGSISAFNSLAGGLASSALSYGLTGEATFNILNISDFGAGTSCGLLEVSVGNKGIKTRLGTGGTDISAGTLISSLSGIKNISVNEKIKKAAKDNNMAQSATALRMLYGFGDEKGLELLDDVLSKKVSLAAGSGPGNAQTVRENGKHTVYLNGYSDNMTREEKLKLGITLGHEAYRDGVKGDELTQKIETRNAVAGHTDMMTRMLGDSLYSYTFSGIIAGDTNLQMDLLARSLGDEVFNDYVDGMYDSSADYWKLMSDGTLVQDEDGWLKDENGNIIKDKDGNKIGADGQETGLLNILFAKQADGSYKNPGKKYDEFSPLEKIISAQIMEKSGISHYYKNEEKTGICDRSWNLDGKALDMNLVMGYAGDSVATAVFMNYFDNMTNSMIDGNTSIASVVSGYKDSGYLV